MLFSQLCEIFTFKLRILKYPSEQEKQAKLIFLIDFKYATIVLTLMVLYAPYFLSESVDTSSPPNSTTWK